MNVLRIESGKSYFIIAEEDVVPDKLSRENLLRIMNDIYESEEDVIFPREEELDNIINPVEKEIVHQIIQKIKDFNNNIVSIRQEVKAQFPLIEE